MSNIRFYIPEGQTIPTIMQAYVDETLVSYVRFEQYFLFFISGCDEENALCIANEIINCIIIENADGHVWSTDSIEIVPNYFPDGDCGLSTGVKVVKWCYRYTYPIKNYKITLDQIKKNHKRNDDK